MEELIDNTTDIKETLEYYLIESFDCRHEWDDVWYRENGKDFYSAISEIISELERYRVKCYYQDDFGKFKCSGMYLWDGTLSRIFDCYSDPKWFDKYFKKLSAKFNLIDKIQSWQKDRINKIFQKVCKKYPKIVNELIVEIEHPEYIIPSKYGIIDGKNLVYKYWRTINDYFKKTNILK